MSCVFTNDNNVSISLIDDPYSELLAGRDHHEILFRRINTLLIKDKIIKNNIVDSGAWIGDNSIPWAKNINGIVYAIEPSTVNCDFISRTCEHNKINNVKTMCVALSDKNETLSTDDDIVHCTFVGFGENAKNKVSAFTLDYLYETKEIDNIGYIHLDVEGMEHRVLQGSSKVIDEFRPIITYEQHINQNDVKSLVEYLNGKNYISYMIDEELPNCHLDCRNLIAFPAELYVDNIVAGINQHMGFNILLTSNKV